MTMTGGLWKGFMAPIIPFSAGFWSVEVPNCLIRGSREGNHAVKLLLTLRSLQTQLILLELVLLNLMMLKLSVTPQKVFLKSFM